MKILLLSVLLVGCAQTKPDFIPYIQEYTTDSGKIWTLGDASKSKRILLIHGLTVDHTTFFDGPQANLTYHLWKEGYQIVWIDLPHTLDPSPYTDLKALLTQQYRDSFQAHVASALNFMDTKFGHVDKLAVGGISWGGLHTLMAAAMNPQFNFYFTLIPVTDITALTGFESYGLSNFSPVNELSNLKDRHYYVAWGAQDQAVNPKMVTTFVSQISIVNTTVTPAFYPDYNHEITYKMIRNLNDWIDTQ